MTMELIHEHPSGTRHRNLLSVDAAGRKTYELNEEGEIKEYITYTGPEGGGVLRTGPVSGTVSLKDGTAYDVTPKHIIYAPGHLGLICHHIAKMHEASGKIADFQNGDPVHTCTEDCGSEAE